MPAYSMDFDDGVLGETLNAYEHPDAYGKYVTAVEGLGLSGFYTSDPVSSSEEAVAYVRFGDRSALSSSGVAKVDVHGQAVTVGQYGFSGAGNGDLYVDTWNLTWGADPPSYGLPDSVGFSLRAPSSAGSGLFPWYNALATGSAAGNLDIGGSWSGATLTLSIEWEPGSVTFSVLNGEAVLATTTQATEGQPPASAFILAAAGSIGYTPSSLDYSMDNFTFEHDVEVPPPNPPLMGWWDGTEIQSLDDLLREGLT